MRVFWKLNTITRENKCSTFVQINTPAIEMWTAGGIQAYCALIGITAYTAFYIQAHKRNQFTNRSMFGNT